MAVSCGVGCRCGSDPAMLWLWCRLVATAPIGPLAWEPPYVTGAALKRQEQKPKPNLSEDMPRITPSSYRKRTGHAPSRGGRHGEDVGGPVRWGQKTHTEWKEEIKLPVSR